MLQDASRAAATLVGRLTIPEQAAHKIAQQITERLADDNAAVSIAEVGKKTAKNTWALAVYFQNARDKNKVRDAVVAAAGREAAVGDARRPSPPQAGGGQKRSTSRLSFRGAKARTRNP